MALSINQRHSLLQTALAFLAQPLAQRLELLPHVWARPVYIDNGYCLEAEQPAAVMQDFCGEHLHLPECWLDEPDFTALALASEEVQRGVEVAITKLEAQTAKQWQDWLNDASSMAEAQATLQILHWSPDLNQDTLHQQLDAETYGTFTAALRNPTDWERPL